MNKKTILMVVIAVIIVVAGGSVYYLSPKEAPLQPVSENNVPEAPAENNSPTVTPSIKTEAAVSISGFAFSPKVVTIEKGSSVRWTNNEVVGHDVVGDDASLGFRSPIMPKGESYVFTFNEAGTFTYYCGVHPAMKGTVIVK